MAVGLAVVLVLVIAHRGTVRDHVDVWWFQFTRKTVTVEPQPVKDLPSLWSTPYVAAFLSRYSGQPVILAADSTKPDRINFRWFEGEVDYQKILEANGYRVLEQRFPRRAYVVIRDEHPSFPSPGIPLPAQLDEEPVEEEK